MSLKTSIPAIVHSPNVVTRIAAGQPLAGLADAVAATLKTLGAVAASPEPLPAAAGKATAHPSKPTKE
ncbi:MAG: hypothetical protein FWG56_11470 [Desulfovibrionaceae bacterium]|nr:hypothetical protein [Desulfovibrionaceae bacterium]